MSSKITPLNSQTEADSDRHPSQRAIPLSAVNAENNDEEENAVTVKRNNYTISYYPNRIVLAGARQSIQEEATRILDRFSFSAQPYRIQSETSDSIIIVPSFTSVSL